MHKYYNNQNFSKSLQSFCDRLFNCESKLCLERGVNKGICEFCEEPTNACKCLRLRACAGIDQTLITYSVPITEVRLISPSDCCLIHGQIQSLVIREE